MMVTIGIVKSRKDYFDIAYKSAKDQIFDGDIEVIVLDNLDKQKSIGRCFNEIAEKAKGEWILYLGDDDFIVPEYVQSLVSSAIGKTTDVTVVNIISRAILFNSKVTKHSEESVTGMWLREYVLKNPFKEDLSKLVDTEMFNRLSESNKYFPAVANHQYGYYYRQHDNNVSGNKLIMNKLNRDQKGSRTLSVGLPLYKAKNTAWIALESLCNQKGIDFEWELLIIEEKEDSFGKDNVMKYKERLEKVGCTRIDYISITDRISLSLKWIRLGEMADSTYFILQSADCYSQPHRLAETKVLFENADADWIQSNKGAFYDIKNNHWALYTYSGSGNTALNMATRTVYLSKLPNVNINKYLDNWMFSNIYENGMNIVKNLSDNWKKGVDIQSKNTISIDREKMMKEYTPPFSELKDKIDIPSYIMKRLEVVNEN